ncbi:MAG: hypothetical protein ABW352_23115 [Polyangiales bacterium]
MRLRRLGPLFMLASVACGDEEAPATEVRDASVRRDAEAAQTPDAGRELDARVQPPRDAAHDSAEREVDASVVDAGERVSGLLCEPGRARVSVDGAPPRSFQIGYGVPLPLNGIDGSGQGTALDFKSLLAYWVQPMPDATIDGPATASLIALDATREGPGELLCSGAGSGWVTARPGAQAEVVLHDVASLGACANGTPLPGSITLCTGFDCDLQGTLGGNEVWAGYGGLLGNDHLGTMSFSASSERSADVWTVIYADYDEDKQNPFPWALLHMSSQSPYPGAFVCARKVVASSDLIIDTSLTLSDFTLLGTCPTDGTRTVRACMLGQPRNP